MHNTRRGRGMSSEPRSNEASCGAAEPKGREPCKDRTSGESTDGQEGEEGGTEKPKADPAKSDKVGHRTTVNRTARHQQEAEGR